MKGKGFHTASCLLGLVSFPLWSLEKYDAGTYLSYKSQPDPSVFWKPSLEAFKSMSCCQIGTYCEVWILSTWYFPVTHRYNWLEITWNSCTKYIDSIAGRSLEALQVASISAPKHHENIVILLQTAHLLAHAFLRPLDEAGKGVKGEKVLEHWVSHMYKDVWHECLGWIIRWPGQLDDAIHIYLQNPSNLLMTWGGASFLANYVHRTGTSQRPASQICSCLKAFLVANW